MEGVITKPKKKKSKQKRLEESIGLIEGTSRKAPSPTDDIILSPLTSKFSETDIITREENEPLCRHDGSPSTEDTTEPDPTEICASTEEELCELNAKVSDLAIAPELDLISTNFDNYYRKEGEAEPESSLPSFSENDAQETGKHNLGCSNIEDEFFEVTKAASTVNELPSFTESQLLSLYHNEEIGLCNVFIENFLENELRSGFTLRHTLYDLLNKYLKSRDKLNSNVLEIESLIKETKDIQQRLWILEVVKITESGECQDGNPVEASHQYQVGTFDEAVLAKLTKTLGIIRERANEQHALHSYSCLTTKLQIENYVRKLISTHSNLPHNAPVSLITEGAIPRTSEICGAVSVLFHFLRQPYKDQGFISDCRNWLQNIVATLLRVSSWREHMFLLNHVLRCPGNVSKWATSYIQAPVPLFDCHNPNAFLDHMICVMATIVGPVKNREIFLSEMERSVDDIEDKWVIVDSEGEDEDSNTSHVTLSENDVIALFNQIPLDCFFSLIYDLPQRDGKYVFTRRSGGQMLKTIAVTRLIIKILGQGFFVYNIPKYLQFAKRLASTMIHTVQFLTDVWETFRSVDVDENDAALIDRLQIEYDNVVKSACTVLISSPQKSVLQFLITLPFSSVSLSTLWHLLQMIIQPPNISGGKPENPADWWIGVEELICSLNDAESCYILTTMCNMGLSRKVEDWCFIKMVATLLLQIGIINNTTKDVCHKTARTQLSNMTHVHPALTSLILHKLKHFVPQAGNLSLYLFRDLPLHLWTPTKEDLGLLEHWLLACPQGSIEGSLAIFILHKMNWGFNPSNPSQLFLSRDVHCRVALLVVRLAILYCPESPSSSHSTVIADTIKQLTSSSNKLITEQTLNIWIWSMLFKLRLHLLDQPEPSVWATLSDPLQFFSILPSLESLPSELSPLIRALKENQVTAVFTALLMTSTGHSIPLICHSGFAMLETLIQCHRYLAVLVLIEHIFPLFIESPGSILMSEKFQNVIISLLAADRTFIKFAMSLISSAFPGLILKQFGDLIEVHLKNYRRYNLISPAPLAEMWLRVLTTAWLTEPLAASYLMDKILSVAFFHPDMRATALGILHELLENHNTSHQQRFSLLNWVTGSNPYGTLMNKSPSDTPWFSLFAIEVEQIVLFHKTTLWDNLLIDLSSCSGKPSIDSSLKKCCAALKLSSIPSSTLPIYRWSQQVLETSVDHPAIPIFWQKFFALFLKRVPSINRKDLGSVGPKFFEGTTNNSLMTKLKKKLLDCKEFYETKCKNDSTIIPQEKRAWYNNMVNLYTCYTLWLEDPSLHDPGVNLYALPASYCSEKLSTIFCSDEVMWMEFVDQDALHHHQRLTMQSWQQCLYRTAEVSSKPVLSPTVQDPLLRIEKRLTKFESPVPPPIMKPQPVLVTDLPTEVLYNKHHTMEFLRDSFKALTSYAQVYWLRSGELSSVDFSLLELAPQLYRTLETQVTLHAACDTHNPGAPQQSINSLTCAGPAVINIKVNEVHVDSSVDMAIHSNRQEAQNLIKRCLQQPNQAVCIGSIQIQEVVRVLDDKCNELRRIGDVQLLNSLQNVGVALFYHMTNFYSEKIIAYPPMKQLITSCAETLGQSFISVDEQQGPMILGQVLENPNLSSLLSTHFSPTTSSPQVYILLYRTLMSAVSASNADLIFVLLTKFDVAVWLDSQKPRLSDRSQLIEIVTDALASSGQDPSQEYIMIHEVLRRQLCALMMADCSQHLPQVLQMALKHSESHSLSTDVWFDILNALVWHTGVQFKPHCAMAQVVCNMATFATQQTVLSLNEIKVIIAIVSKFFTDERLQYGLYGLYPKYRTYISAFTTFLGVLSHTLIAAVVKKNKNDPGSNVCAEIWPTFLSLFTPWICPYFTHDLVQPTAAWIQQLTDDRSILLPWISADSGHAHKITAIFTESIRFLLDILPGNKDIFGYIWQFYVSNFAHTSVKDHILTVINNNLLSLNWQRFTPGVNDLELMLRVSDTYVPCCHSFLGAVFIDVPWTNMIDNGTPQHSPKIHASLLHLLVKLSIEPNVRQSGKLAELLRSSKMFHWEAVDFGSYESVVNWFVMSYDPRVVLNVEQDEGHIDQSVMELLRYSAGFAHSLPGYHSSTPRKRQVFVRAYVKLIISCLSKYKAIASSHQPKVESAIEDLLVLINTVVPQTGGNVAEAGLLVSEVLSLINLTSGPASRIGTDTLVTWLSKRGDCIVAAALLRTVGTNVEQTSLIGEIMESVLQSIFNDQSGGDWDKTLNHLQEPIPRNPPVENHLAENCQLLTLYAFLTKRLSTLFDLSEEMDIFTSLTKLISSMQPVVEKSEKIIPLYHLCLIMAARLSDSNPIVCDKNLRSLVQSAEAWAEYKPSWGFLGAIGLKRQHSLSSRMKAICKMLCALILIQLPENKSDLPCDNNVPFIRTTPQSPGGFTSNSTELGPSAEAHKAFSQLEAYINDKSYSEVREALEIALGFIRRTENSMHNAHQLFLRVSKMLFPDIRFIQAITLGT